MACPAYGSTSGVSLFWTADADPNAALGVTLTWNEVPITSESLSANLTSTVSDRITAARSYAGSAPSKGEVSGSISYEAEVGLFLNTMLQAVLQASGTWTTSIKNGSTPMCLAFLKKVVRSGGTDYFVYRGVQVSSLSGKVSPGALITGEIALTGIRPGAGAAGATDNSNDVLSTIPAGWTLTPLTTGNLLSSGYGLKNLEILDSADVEVGVAMQELTFTFNNQLRVQDAIGTGSPYPAGVASGRFEAKITSNVYYSGPQMINALMTDEKMKITFDLLDADGKGWTFNFAYVKPLTAPSPQAGGADQDLMTSTEFQAFEDETTGTVTITKVTP